MDFSFWAIQRLVCENDSKVDCKKVINNTSHVFGAISGNTSGFNLIKLLGAYLGA